MGEIGNFFNIIFTFPILNGLTLLYHLFNDFGLSIIVLTLIIKLVLFPLTLQSLKSSKVMQAMQPKMQELRKKYKSDPMALNREMQAMYKEAGYNPAAGCLPMLVQLPVLYGLYYAINTFLQAVQHNTLADINQRLYPFVQPFAHLPNINLNWFTFLNAGWHFSLGQPDPTHILPILAGIATYVQLRMSQPKPTGPVPANAAPDPTAQSMKMMQLLMPFMTVFIGWTFPSGMALYWTVSYLFQVVQQYFITGWGSLFEMPDFLNIFGGSKSTPQSKGTSSNREINTDPRETKSKTYTGDSRREREILDQAEGDTLNGDGPVGRKLRTVDTSGQRGASQYNRRQRSSSSARRRSAQKSRS